MAIPTVSMDETSPAGSQAKSLGDNRIREYKTQNREVMEVDHEYPISGQSATAGQHKQVTLQEQADLGTGAVGATILGSQTISGKGELVYTDEDNNDVQITNAGKNMVDDNSIDSQHYVDGSIDKVHLSADCIDSTKIADNAINSEHYVDGSIDAVHLSADCVDGTKIADDSINSEHYVDGSIDNAHLANSSVSCYKLKRGVAEDSYTNTGATLTYEVVTIAGGAYAFFPQIKVSNSYTRMQLRMYGADGGSGGYPGLSYITRATMGVHSGTGYISTTYVTASGPEHWLFLLTDKLTGNIISAWSSPDHPCYGQDADEEQMPHPFISYDKTKHNIVLADNEILKELRTKITRQKSLLTLVNENCMVDFESNPKYEDRETVEIDELGDMKGKKLGEFKTPDWAKIKIKKDTFSLKKRIIAKLPPMILYKKLRLKDKTKSMIIKPDIRLIKPVETKSVLEIQVIKLEHQLEVMAEQINKVELIKSKVEDVKTEIKEVKKVKKKTRKTRKKKVVKEKKEPKAKKEKKEPKAKKEKKKPKVKKEKKELKVKKEKKAKKEKRARKPRKKVVKKAAPKKEKTKRVRKPKKVKTVTVKHRTRRGRNNERENASNASRNN